MNSILISKNGLNKMFIIEWVYEAHTKPQGLAWRDLKGSGTAFDNTDKMLCGGFLSGAPLRPAQQAFHLKPSDFLVLSLVLKIFSN